MFSLALFQPDIPQNTGAIMRLAACFNVSLEIIEPCGFIFSHPKIQRSVMDYTKHLNYTLHAHWQDFQNWRLSHPIDRNNPNDGPKRLILFSTKTQKCYDDFYFQKHDILLFGNESSGVPDYVHQQADAIVTIPIQKTARSLNLAMSAAIATAHLQTEFKHRDRI